MAWVPVPPELRITRWQRATEQSVLQDQPAVPQGLVCVRFQHNSLYCRQERVVCQREREQGCGSAMFGASACLQRGPCRCRNWMWDCLVLWKTRPATGPERRNHYSDSKETKRRPFSSFCKETQKWLLSAKSHFWVTLEVNMSLFSHFFVTLVTSSSLLSLFTKRGKSLFLVSFESDQWSLLCGPVAGRVFHKPSGPIQDNLRMMQGSLKIVLHKGHQAFALNCWGIVALSRRGRVAPRASCQNVCFYEMKNMSRRIYVCYPAPSKPQETGCVCTWYQK